MQLSAVILAGGRSVRMGRDKALLRINGETLLARTTRLAHEAGAAPVYLSGREGVPGALPDRHPGHVRFFGKPFAEVYTLVERTLPGVAAGRIVMCGDTLHTDILGAAARGWRTVLVTRDGLFAGVDTAGFSARSGLFADWRLDRI